MAKEILKCVKCSSYTMKNLHCDEKTVSVKPAKYSPEDKWSKWRLLYKKQFLE